MKSMKNVVLCISVLALVGVASASTIGANDWTGAVSSDFTAVGNWTESGGAGSPPAGFELDRNYADYTRWVLSSYTTSTVVSSIANAPVIDGTLLMQRTRVMGDTTVTIANGGVFDAWSFQIGGYGGDGHIVVDAGGLMTIGTVENNYVANNGPTGSNGVLDINGTVFIASNGFGLYLGGTSSSSFGQINIGSTGVLDYDTSGGGGLTVNYGNIYMDDGATYVRNGDWTGVDLLSTGDYSVNDGSWIEYNYDGSRTTMTVVPEPATLVLLGVGGLLLRRRR